MRPVSHSKDLPLPHPATHEVEDKTNTEIGNKQPYDVMFDATTSSSEPYLLTQCELNDHFRDF